MEDDPAYQITVTRVTDTESVDDLGLRKAIEATLRRHQSRAARIGVALVDDGRMAELNQRHLRHAGPTDVLTFDLRDGKTGPGGADDPAVEGEIVVSVETAAREAASRGHHLDAELALYVVHGTLHLLGYDDDREEDAAHMHALEDEILAGIGVGTVFRSEPK